MQGTEISRNWVTGARRRFTARRAEKPATKAGQIRALWPEIKAALAEGQSMKTVRTWLEVDAGVTVSITSLTSYISRIRRRELRHSGTCTATAFQTQPHETMATPSRVTDGSNAAPHDPLASAMAILRQPRFDIRELHGNGDPTNKNLI